ncbi:LPS-assembly protein LptD [Pandoraea communis]|uniref:LPS-assembly protein LptD n=1 Tax=Pandoraea communis TaxID=2508297 RepID=A0A5E4W5E1_9BURK|nr:LPS-assembly protein LptD [Pandoraea communis]MDM8356487.1 LPS-assembly protein LptD [Pandoraea communis]VVE19363.1 LPS-assembly protein LptD [Pandoraea communis]
MSRQSRADIRDWLPASGATIVTLFAYMPDKQVHTNDDSSLRRLMRTRRKPLALLLSLPGVWCSLAGAQEAPPPDIARSDGLVLRTVPALVDNPLGAGEDVPMYVRGMHLTGRTNVDATVDDDAEARKYRQFVKGDRLTYDQDSDEVVARGNARLSQGGNLFVGPEAHMYTGAGDGYMLTPTYRLVSGGGGKSERADIEANNLVTMQRGTYSACACTDEGQTPAWYIKASEFEFDQEQQEGTAYNGILFFQGVPIFASPYLSFPTSNERRSGFLAPTFTQSTRTGFELSTPYYFNIAPNRDLTITPRFMTKRGVMLNGDFRYLEPTYSGLFHLEYLPKDRVTGDARYTFTWQHSQSLGYGVNGYVNFTKVSDDTYPDDFGSGTNFQTGVQRVYNREAGLTWGYGNWSFLARVLKYQTLAPTGPQYESVPELSATYNKLDFHGFDFTMPIRYNRFQIASSTGQPNGERLYAQPTLSYPILTPGYFVVPKVIFNAASYNVNYPNGSMMQSSITRTVPTFSLDTGLTFERPVNLFGTAMRQTLEPRLFYVYTPYRDQSSIPIFDSAVSDFNLAEIFSENSFIGVDRIQDANRVTMALTSRLIDAESGVERGRVWYAQRYNIQQSLVTMPGGKPENAGVSDFLVGGSALLYNNITFTSNVQYSPNTSQFNRGDAGITWRPGERRVFNLYYRYLRNPSPVVGQTALSITPINQIELSGQWPITPRLGVVGRLNYSITDKTFIDALAGFEYDADCWAFRVGLQRYATNATTTTSRIFAQLELKGLTKSGNSATEAFKVGVPGYQAPPTNQIPSRFSNYE